jgi:DNA invertase Pin-like site-specific DNA recombinase
VSVNGYIRPTPDAPKRSADFQREAIRHYCWKSGLLPKPRSDAGPAVAAEPLWFIDVASSGRLRLGDREAGGVLLRDVRSGDHVVIATLDRAFAKLRDFCTILDTLNRRGVHLHIAALRGQPVNLSQCRPDALVRLLEPFVELERASRAERTGEDSRDRRARGLGLGRPRLGFKYVSRVRTLADGRKRRFRQQENDPEERAVMKLILGWRREAPPRSWDEIRKKLNYELKLRTRTGSEWSTARIRRACKAEFILQALEARGCRDADAFPVLARLADRAAATDEGRDPVGKSG